jgi:DNA-binding FrmR family transcriptional regulator
MHYQRSVKFLSGGFVESDRERTKLINRAKRIHGQMETVERSLIENHLRLHMGAGSRPMTPEIAEELIDLVRAYLK